VTWQLELHEKAHKTGNQKIIIDVLRKLWYIEIETTRKNAFWAIKYLDPSGWRIGIEFLLSNFFL